MTGENIDPDVGAIPESNGESKESGHNNQVSGNLQYPLRRRIQKAAHYNLIDDNESDDKNTDTGQKRRCSSNKSQKTFKSPKQ